MMIHLIMHAEVEGALIGCAVHSGHNSLEVSPWQQHV